VIDDGMMGSGSLLRKDHPMLEFFQAIVNMHAPFNMIVLVVLIGSVAGVLAGIAKEIRKYGCHRQDIDFKRELVDRGLSVDEIERIIAAQGAERDGKAVTVNGNYFAPVAPTNS
jgi:hypothetical protein